MGKIVEFPQRATVMTAHGVRYLVPQEDEDLFDWMLRCFACSTPEFDSSWPRHR